MQGKEDDIDFDHPFAIPARAYLHPVDPLLDLKLQRTNRNSNLYTASVERCKNDTGQMIMSGSCPPCLDEYKSSQLLSKLGTVATTLKDRNEDEEESRLDALSSSKSVSAKPDPSRPLSWTRRASSQIFIYMIYSMFTLGPYNGLNGLGGGGMRDVLLVTKLNALYSISLAIFGWLGGAAFNYFGCRPVCIAAGGAYLFYIVVLALITLYEAPSVLALPTGIFLGAGAAFLWATFGVVSIRYPSPLKQARVFSIMWGMVNVGGFLCGLVSLFTNMSPSRAHASAASYGGLMLAVTFGTVVAAGGLRHQDEIIRSDGETAGNDRTHATLKQTFRHAIEAVTDRRLLLLWPAFLVPFAHHPFLFNGMNAQYFNIRSRSLNSSLYWGARIPGGALFYVACRQRSKYKKPGDSTAEVKQCLARRLMPGFYLTFAWSALALTVSNFSIYNTFGNLTPPQSLGQLMDFSHNYPTSLLAIMPFITFGILDSLVQSLLYNVLGALGGEESGRTAVFSGFYKTLQSLTVGLLWFLDWMLSLYNPSVGTFPARYKAQWIIMCFLWIAAFPGTLLTLLHLRKMPETFVYHGLDLHESSNSMGPKGKVVNAPLEPLRGCMASTSEPMHGRLGDFPMRQPTRIEL